MIRAAQRGSGLARNERYGVAESATNAPSKMNATELITKLSTAFRRYDESAKPLGLYAISEARGLEKPDQENWGDLNFVLKPVLGELGYTIFAGAQGRMLREGEFYFFRPESSMLFIRLVRLSKVKVRQFGNAYHVDPHDDFTARWQEARVDSLIRKMADSKYHFRYVENQSVQSVLTFLGFAKEDRPFFKELAELAENVPGAVNRAATISDAWADPHGRGFHTLCSCWHWRS